MHEFAHYLEAKRTVDDRALNRRVWDRLQRELESVDEPAIADIGAGIGTGLERLLEWDLVQNPKYTGIEQDRDLARIARSRNPDLRDRELIASTLAEFASDPDHHRRFDLVMAHAFLDVVELGPAIRDLAVLARPAGLVYLPITYDGETIFEPADADDRSILDAYHRAMDASGSSQTGRRLFHALEQAQLEIVALGSSDWIVSPNNHAYPHDEAFFLGYVLSLIEQTVGTASVSWVAKRRRQLRDGQLLYIAHQLDYLARKPG